MKKYIKKKEGVAFLLILLTISLSLSDTGTKLVSGYTELYNEDFSSITYLDEIATNASGWGDGEIRQPIKEPGYNIVDILPAYSIARDVVLYGDYAYVINEDRLQIVNISNPRNLTLESNVSIASGSEFGYIDGYWLFITYDQEGSSGFDIWEIRDPKNPLFIESSTTPSKSIFVDGVNGFTADNVLSIWQMDVTYIGYGIVFDRSSFYDTGIQGYAWDVVVKGDYAYVANGNQGMSVVDVSSLVSPSLAGHYDLPYSDEARSIFVKGNYAYLTTLNHGLIIIDISNPSSPTFVSSCDTFDEARDISVNGDYAYIACGYNGIQVININNPLLPKKTGWCNTSGYAYNVKIEGNYAYVADGYNGLQVIEISNIVNISLLGDVSTHYRIDDLEIDGKYAYTTGGLDFNVYDISNHSNPVLVDTYMETTFESFTLIGDIAYICTGSDIFILDITDPLNVQFLGVDESISARYMAVSGHLAYVIVQGFDCYVNTYRIEDSTVFWPLDDPPGGYSISLPVADILVSGHFAYIVSIVHGLEMVLLEPFYGGYHDVGIYDIPEYISDVALSGNLAYLATSEGMHVFDTGTIYYPSYVGHYNTTQISRIFISGDLAFLAGVSGNFEIVNISDPANPTFVDSYVLNADHYLTDVCVLGDYAYVVDYDGLHVFEIRRNKAKYFESSCTAQSTLINSENSKRVVNATINVEEKIPDNTSIRYYLSVDDGFTWEQVEANVPHIFTIDDYRLKWKAILESNNESLTPTVLSLSIGFNAIVIISEFSNFSSYLIVLTTAATTTFYLVLNNSRKNKTGRCKID